MVGLVEREGSWLELDMAGGREGEWGWCKLQPYQDRGRGDIESGYFYTVATDE